MARNRVDWSEDDLVSGLADRLTEQGWEVDEHPLFGLYRPDLVLRAPDGHEFVAEVANETGVVHFSGLGQAAAYQSGLAAFANRQASPLLLSTGEATEELERLAAGMDVELITASNTDLETAVEEFAEALLQLQAAVASTTQSEGVIQPDAKGTPTTIEGLSSQELEVARLAASGRANREIAESLQLSIATVEEHLKRVYKKLGVNDSDALGQLLPSSDE